MQVPTVVPPGARFQLDAVAVSSDAVDEPAGGV
jgi:hypothetical protein